MSSDVTTTGPLPIPPPLAGEGREGVRSEHPVPRASGGLASPGAILLGSLAFGIVFLLIWQFLPLVRALEAKSLVEAHGGVVAIQNVQPDCLHAGVAKTVQYRPEQ